MALQTQITTNNTPTNHSATGQNGGSLALPIDQFQSTVAAPDHGRYVSLDEYWAVWYEAEPSYEWNNGTLEAKPMPNLIQLNLFHWFLEIMRQYVATFQNAQLMSLETGFTMQVPDSEALGALKKVVRKPDLAAILHTNPVTWQDHERSYRGICDLCVEALSDSSVEEILRDTNIKKSEYEFAGVQEYYILDPSGNHMAFYELSPDGDYVAIEPDKEGVIRSKVLPGFQFRYSDLNKLRSLEALAMDEVYSGFVLLQYQAAERRARQAEHRAQSAEHRAQSAEHRAQRYAAKLRAMGIDLEDLPADDD